MLRATSSVVLEDVYCGRRQVKYTGHCRCIRPLIIAGCQVLSNAPFMSRNMAIVCSLLVNPFSMLFTRLFRAVIVYLFPTNPCCLQLIQSFKSASHLIRSLRIFSRVLPVTNSSLVGLKLVGTSYLLLFGLRTHKTDEVFHIFGK